LRLSREGGKDLSRGETSGGKEEETTQKRLAQVPRTEKSLGKKTYLTKQPGAGFWGAVQTMGENWGIGEEEGYRIT